MRNKPVVSLVGFGSVEEIARHAKKYPSVFYELSYKMSVAFLDAVTPFLEGRVASVHACCPSLPIFPNFGSHDQQVLQESYAAVEDSLKTAHRFGADILVLHPGYACDQAIPAENQERTRLLDGPLFEPYIGVKQGSICKPDYCSQPIYQHHATQAIKQLVDVGKLATSYGVKLAVENLNPRVGYLFQTPQEMLALAQKSPDLHLCLDIGHLWISSAVYGFSYLSSLEQIVATKKVVNCHLHSNSTKKDMHIFSDDHHSVDRHGFPIHAVLDILAMSEANLVLETVEALDHNTDILLQELVSRGDSFAID